MSGHHILYSFIWLPFIIAILFYIFSHFQDEGYNIVDIFLDSKSKSGFAASIVKKNWGTICYDIHNANIPPSSVPVSPVANQNIPGPSSNYYQPIQTEVVQNQNPSPVQPSRMESPKVDSKPNVVVDDTLGNTSSLNEDFEQQSVSLPKKGFRVRQFDFLKKGLKSVTSSDESSTTNATSDFSVATESESELSLQSSKESKDEDSFANIGKVVYPFKKEKLLPPKPMNKFDKKSKQFTIMAAYGFNALHLMNTKVLEDEYIHLEEDITDCLRETKSK